MPENEAYDMAKRVGILADAAGEEDPRDSTSAGEDGLEALRSRSVVRSVIGLCVVSAVVEGVVAVVNTVGAVFGARRGDRGGVAVAIALCLE